MRGVPTIRRCSVGLARFGCVNRPFFQIVVYPHKAYGRYWEGSIIEQLGSFDPIPNKNGEKLVAINFSRLNYWVTQDVTFSRSILQLLGLSGYFPVHPETYIKAKQQREIIEKIEQSKKEEKEKESEVEKSN